jgi:DNA-nicking Smr family endonuclease
LNNNISDKDKKDWENFLSNDEKLTDKDLKIKNKKSLKIKSIDLHGYTLEQANVAVENFIIRSYEEQIGKLIIVTGKEFIHKMKKTLIFQKI